MFENARRRRAAGRVRPGDGHELPRYRWWQPFSRSLFHLRLDDADGTPHRWSVDVGHAGDADGEVLAKLYLDGRNRAVSKLPAVFEVPGGVIEVATSGYGLKRCHFVPDEGPERQLVADERSAEGRRAKLARDRPGTSRAIGAVSIVVLLVSLVLGVPQLAEDVTNIPWVAERVGTFVSPIRLPGWMNVSLVVGALVASTERALRLRHSRVLDSGLFDGDD